MAKTSPRGPGRMETKIERDFFRRISESCNYVDEDFVRLFYVSFFVAVTQELHRNGSVHLPYIGDFTLKEEQPKWRWKGPLHVKDTRPREILRFRPKRQWKRGLTAMM